MSKFTASNGAKVWTNSKGVVCAEDFQGSDKVWTQAIREFFRHERDKELGRWRWPENPDYAVSLSEGGEAVWVLNERDAGMLSFTREMNPPSYEYGDEAGYARAAWAYFDAHPKRKPWRDAQPGEVWVFDWTCDQDVAKLEPSGQWRKFDGEAITSGDLSYVKDASCIWPEKSND